MAQHIGFEFSTREFELSHGRSPKGRGSWAFEYDGQEPVFTPGGMTYLEAKAWVKTRIRSEAPADFVGVVVVNVCP